MVGHLLEYHPGILKLKQMVSDGELGKINYIHSTRLNLGKFRTGRKYSLEFCAP